MQREPYNHDELPAGEAGPRDAPIGQVLRRAREAQHLSIDDVADQLKFSARQLAALEQERFGDLPGSTFARGMVRSYARMLKLDAEPLLAQLEGKFEVPDPNRLLARYRQPVPFSNNARRSNVAYAVVSVAVLAVVAAVAFEWQQERNNAGQLAFVPAARAPVEPASPAPASATSESPGRPEVASAPAEASAPVAPKLAEPPVPKPVAAPKAVAAPKPSATVAKPVVEAAATPPTDAPPAPADATTARTMPASSGPRVVLRFEEESWVEVYDSTGKTLMAQLNPAGSVRVVRGEPPYSLVIGNAQHVQVVYGDKIVDLTPHIRVEVARLKLE